MSDAIVPVQGFRFSAVSAGIRKDGRIDLGLAVADSPSLVAARFTRNRVQAAPVLIARERTRTGRAQAIVANSGGANACTGEPGMLAARRITGAVAESLGIDPSLVLPASTGVIGAELPVDSMLAQIPKLVEGLGPENAAHFAQAICTTDRWIKMAQAPVGAQARVLGIAKGAGMIHPDLALGSTDAAPHATMLVFLFTDAVVEQVHLNSALDTVIDDTFNAASVDGDTSTNDTVQLLASGTSGQTVSPLQLEQSLFSVCNELAESMVRDGEGTRHLAELWVRGTETNALARQIARSIATSLLVKTAMAGEDPNWGRWLAAAGRSGVELDPDQMSLFVDGIRLVEHGVAEGPRAEAEAREHMQRPRYVVELNVGSGPGAARYLMCDLGHEYVDINAGYRS